MRFALRPELRREQPRREIDSGVPEKHPGDIDSPDRTNLDPVDISIDSSESESTSESDSLEFCFQRAHCSLDSARIGLEVQDISDTKEPFDDKQSRKRIEKEREKEDFTENVFTTGGSQVPVTTSPVINSNSAENTLAAGGQPVPVIASPADIYRYFPRRLNYEKSPQDDLHSEKRSNSSEETSSSDTSESTRNKEKHRACETETPGTMQAEVLQKLQDQVTMLQRELHTQQERNREFHRQTISAMEQAPIPDTSSSQRTAAFHGLDSEDINHWLDKVENYLKLRRIPTDSPTALAELVLNLAGLAEDF